MWPTADHDWIGGGHSGPAGGAGKCGCNPHQRQSQDQQRPAVPGSCGTATRYGTEPGGSRSLRGPIRETGGELWRLKSFSMVLTT